MKSLPSHWRVTLFVAFSLTGCSSTSDEKVYDIKGKVVAVQVEEKKITLDHDAIPGVMKAMEMSFDVHDAKVVENLKAGDDVEGRLKMASGKYIIIELRKR